MENENIIHLSVGDRWADGHGKHEAFFIRTNFSSQDIKDAYKSGTAKIGFNLSAKVARDYEDNCIWGEEILKLKRHGFQYEYGPEYDELAERDILNAALFVDIYLFICKLGNPNFKYSLINIPIVDVGGYGLYY